MSSYPPVTPPGAPTAPPVKNLDGTSSLSPYPISEGDRSVLPDCLSLRSAPPGADRLLPLGRLALGIVTPFCFGSDSEMGGGPAASESYPNGSPAPPSPPQANLLPVHPRLPFLPGSPFPLHSQAGPHLHHPRILRAPAHLQRFASGSRLRPD